MATDSPSLTRLEAAILDQICSGQAALREWLCDAVVERRQFTGAGSFTYFADAPATGERAAVGLSGLFEVPGVARGLGAALFCRDGHPEFLEVFTFEGTWDGKAEDFVFNAG